MGRPAGGTAAHTGNIDFCRPWTAFNMKPFWRRRMDVAEWHSQDIEYLQTFIQKLIFHISREFCVLRGHVPCVIPFSALFRHTGPYFTLEIAARTGFLLFVFKPRPTIHGTLFNLVRLIHLLLFLQGRPPPHGLTQFQNTGRWTRGADL